MKTLAERFIEKYKGKKMWWTEWTPEKRPVCPRSANSDNTFIDATNGIWQLYEEGDSEHSWIEYTKEEYRAWKTTGEVPLGETYKGSHFDEMGVFTTTSKDINTIWVNGRNSQYWFDNYTMKDGSPCGVKI